MHRRTALAGGAVGVLVALTVRATLLEPLVVESSSMSPALEAGDTMLTTRWAPEVDELRRGDLVVFSDPAEHRLTLKRVVGLPGQVIVVLDGIMHVNGHPVAEPWVEPGTQDGTYTRTFRVPADAVFVMGDNRGNSIDSRDYGSIGAEELRGEVLLRVWPLGTPG